jgi:hypothetical protein
MTCRRYTVNRRSATCILIVFLLPVSPVLLGQRISQFDLGAGSLELTGPAESWRFVNAGGEKAGIGGFESGVLEGWVYPLK